MEEIYSRGTVNYGGRLPSVQAPKQSQQVIVFVGDQLAFSGRLLNLVAADFTEAEIMHVDDLPGIQRFDPLMRSSVSLIVVDEDSCTGFQDMSARLSLFRNDLTVVFAYHRPESARAFFAQSQRSDNSRPVRFLPMNVAIDAWLATLKLIVLGEDFLPSEILDTQSRLSKATPCARDQVPVEQSPGSTPEPLYPELENLTARETQIMALIAKGRKNRSIAEELGLSVHTVKLHVHNIFGKLGVANRTSASRKFYAHHSSR